MFQKITFQQSADRVVVIKDGSLVMDLEWNGALEFGQAMIAQARRAEEWANRDHIVIDQAIVTRAGLSLPVATHPKIQAEALKQSRWNSMLRRFMPVKKELPEKIGRLMVSRGNLL